MSPYDQLTEHVLLICELVHRPRQNVTTGGGRSGRDLTLDPVVEFGSSAQQQVDARAEGGVGRQEQGGLPALLLRPHPAEQLSEDKKLSPSTQQGSNSATRQQPRRLNYGGPEGNMFCPVVCFCETLLRPQCPVLFL